MAEPWILYGVQDGAERIAGRIGGMLEAARKLGSRAPMQLYGVGPERAESPLFG